MVRFIDKNETKETGVSIQTIQDYFVNLDPIELREAISHLLERNKIYEEYPGRFRTTPIE